MSTKELHAKYQHIMEASIKAKMSTLAMFDIWFEGVSAVEYYMPEAGIPDCDAYHTISFDYWGQHIAGEGSIMDIVENVNAVSLYLQMPSGKVVETGFIPIEKMFTGYGVWFNQLVEHVESYGSRKEVSSIQLPF
jgi:hypothetical protein